MMETVHGTGIAIVTAGTGPNYYAFFNSPSHGGDWGTKEDLKWSVLWYCSKL